jgi:acyl-CoA dehydrogenase family member 9
MDNKDTFARSLFAGEINEDLVFPYPQQEPHEAAKVDRLIESLLTFVRENYDERQVEEKGWVGDSILAGLGERGLMGLFVPEEYGGQGLSQTGYCRVFETIGAIDSTLAIVLGVHQSIGTKGIYLFGTQEQKERFLPDLASGRKLAAFALTEPEAGSDAYNVQCRAVRQPDGSYVLHGEKRYIGNGAKDVITTFARTDEGKHVALILEKGMPGLEVGRRYPTLGLRGNDLRHLYYKAIRVPKENVLGEEGDGFKIAVEILNTGRLSLGTGSVGAVGHLMKLGIQHTTKREQFGQPLANFELVQEKIGWMAAQMYGLRAMAYLTTGMVDRGVSDIAIESAMIKVAGTEFLWYAANRVFQLVGGQAYMRDQPFEKILRDIRIFPIFEGANDVMRMFIALSGIKPLGKELSHLSEMNLAQPLQSASTLVEYVGGRVRREVRPDRLSKHHPNLEGAAAPIAAQVKRLRDVSEGLLRQHGRKIVERQLQLERLAEAASEIYGQVAAISYTSQVLEEKKEAAVDQFMAETYCQQAAARAERLLDETEKNSDRQVLAIARHVYHREGYDLFSQAEENADGSDGSSS